MSITERDEDGNTVLKQKGENMKRRTRTEIRETGKQRK